MLLEESVDFHAGFVAEHLADFGLGELVVAVAFDGESFERDAGGVLAGGGELGG